MPICSNFPGRRQDLLSSTASSQPVKNLGAGTEGTNGEGRGFGVVVGDEGKPIKIEAIGVFFLGGERGKTYIFFMCFCSVTFWL